MTLRVKTLLIVGLGLVALFNVLYVVLSRVVQQGFSEVEVQIAQRSVRSVVEALNDDVDRLSSAVGDWAPWDDTYQFVRDGNQQYIDSNLGYDTFENLGVDMMLFVTNAQRIIYGEAYDPQSGEAVRLPESLTGHLARDNTLLDHPDPQSEVSGFILLPEGPLLVASQPILTSANGGPARGTLLMARYLNEDRVALLAQRAGLPLDFERLDGSAVPANFERAAAALAEMEQGAVLVEPLDERQVAGYTVLRDVYGQPALMLQVVMPREVYAQGQSTLRVFVLALAGLGVVFVVLALVSLERLVLARVARLSAEVGQISASGNQSMRLSLPGSDELSGLAQAINDMLQALQESEAREESLKMELQTLRIQIDQTKKGEQVAEIVESQYFKELEAKVRDMRDRRARGPRRPKGKSKRG